MAIISERKKRERRDIGTVTKEILPKHIGTTIDFMGIAEGFRIVAVNVTVEEAFTNADNTISVGLEEDFERFIPATGVNAIKGIPFNNRQFTALKSTAIVVDVVGTASATGRAIVTVSYLKQASTVQEY